MFETKYFDPRFWAITVGDYEWLERAWVPIEPESERPTRDEGTATAAKPIAVERPAAERAERMARFRFELERTFRPKEL